MSLAGLQIKKMQEEHVHGIHEVEKACFSLPWTIDGICAELKNENARFFVALKEKKVVGYVGMHDVFSCCYVANVAVLPEFRRMGIAKRLMQEILDYGKKTNAEFLSLEVRQSNVAAISLYESLGFEEVGVRKNFYERPTENAVIMTKFFKE